MASRLYRTTQALYLVIEGLLGSLGIASIGSPTLAALICLYVTGLVILDGRRTQTRVALILPARCHDALNRLLRLMPLSTRMLMTLLVSCVKRLGIEGYLCLDDVIVEKAFADKLPWAGWTYSWSKERKLFGLHIVVLVWCSLDGRWRIPVAFRIQRPKRSCGKRGYQTKLELAWDMLREVVASGLPFQYLAMDTVYTAGWFSRGATRLGLVWVGTLQPKTTVVYQGKRFSVKELGLLLHLKWRRHLEVRALSLAVYTPSYGMLKLVVTRNRHGSYDYIATNDLEADLTKLVLRKRSRWSVETVFRDTKQLAGLESCQARVDRAMVRHVSLVLLSFAVLQFLRSSPSETVGQVKQRWQTAIARAGESPPPPLKACPPYLRPHPLTSTA